jgi:hypothetical protein
MSIDMFPDPAVEYIIDSQRDLAPHERAPHTDYCTDAPGECTHTRMSVLPENPCADVHPRRHRALLPGSTSCVCGFRPGCGSRAQEAFEDHLRNRGE